jgi:hypothetical protein
MIKLLIDLILKRRQNQKLLMVLVMSLSTVAAAFETVPFDFYSESYTAPLQNNFVHFQRLRLKSDKFAFFSEPKISTNFFVGIENNNNFDNNNLVPELGAQLNYSQLQALISYRLEYANKKEFSENTLRVGLTYGDFWRLPVESSFFEHYSEAFDVVPQKSSSYIAYSTWLKLGWRWIEKLKFSFDPLVVGYRFYDNTNVAQVGSDYRMGQLGFQARYVVDSHAVVSVEVFKAWTDSRQSGSLNKANFWALFTIGVSY